MRRAFPVAVFVLTLALGAAFAVAQEGEEPLLAQLERAFRAAAAAVERSVVEIEVERDAAESGGRGSGVPAYALRPSGPVTGIAVEKNCILTSAYNVEGAKAVFLLAPEGRRVAARVLGRDEGLDLALLEIAADAGVALAPAAFVDGAKLPAVGTWLIAVGRGPSVNAGIVSAHGRFRGDAIATDASLNYGNYGGAAVDIRGRLVGIPVRLSPRTGVNSGVGFVIPAAKVREVLPILARGEVRKQRPRGFLGVQFGKERIDPPGVEIERVVDRSGAAEAGLEKGDVIRGVGGTPVVDIQSASDAIQNFKPGDTARIEIERDGRAISFEVTLGERPVER